MMCRKYSEPEVCLFRGYSTYASCCHEVFELICVQKGILYIHTSQKFYRLEAGDICVVPPYSRHILWRPQVYCEYIRFKFYTCWQKQEEGEALLSALSELILVSREWENAVKSEADKITSAMYREYLEKGIYWEIAEEALFDRLLLLFLRKLPKRKKAKHALYEEKLEKALEYIAMNYDRDICLDGCAETVGFNSTYFSRFFSNHMDITFQEYVKELRVAKAKRLLVSEKMPVTEICYRSGFRDIRTFNKLFKQLCGQSPSSYKKAVLRKALAKETAAKTPALKESVSAGNSYALK